MFSSYSPHLPVSSYLQLTGASRFECGSDDKYVLSSLFWHLTLYFHFISCISQDNRFVFHEKNLENSAV